jgi:hypothetical protein
MGKNNNDKEKLYRNLILLIKLFSGRPLHLSKFLIDNNALNQEFIDNLVSNEKLSEVDNNTDDSILKAVYFVDISHMKDYFNSMLDEKKLIDTKRDLSKELNDKLDRFIKEEKFEEAVRLRDYMSKNNIQRRE